MAAGQRNERDNPPSDRELVREITAQVQEITTVISAWDTWEATTPDSAEQVAEIRACGRRWCAELTSMRGLLLRVLEALLCRADRIDQRN